MITEYEISMLYNSAFGYRGLPFTLPESRGVGQVENLSRIGMGEKRNYAEDLIYSHSKIGSPLYMPTGFVWGTGSLLQLPNEPIITCSIRKNIIETALAGNTRKGTVKEIINTEDWLIEINGLCIDPYKNGYPADEVNSIQQLFELNSRIEIRNFLCNNIFGIKYVVIKDIQWKAMQGKPYSQAYSMNLVSDEDFLLIID